MKAYFFKSISKTKKYKGKSYRVLKLLDGKCTIICDTVDRKMLIENFHTSAEDAIGEFKAKVNLEGK